MHTHSERLKRLSLGAAGGLAGTVMIRGLMAAGSRVLPEANPPMQREPGDFMVEKAETALPETVRRQLPRAAETALATSLGVGYELTFGVLYAALRPRGGSAFVDGAVLGLASWAAGFLGWLPALGLMPPVHHQKPLQVAGPLVDHLAYGIATVAAFDWLRDRFNPAIPGRF